MECNVSIQPTPNPNALKFVLNVPAKSRDSAVFKSSGADAGAVPLAEALLKLPAVTEVYFSGYFITVTQSGSADWDVLEKAVRKVILENIGKHNPDFELKRSSSATPVKAQGELGKIEDILDRTIRPALQRDGGDLQVMSLEGKVLTISYQGACGCCPHAAMGTLYAIQNILRDQYDPELVIEMA
ncbi:MAG: NifU family protein [Candidatus Omnitrophica bacterium]|nr:NifU family protein [Candidatus Omnitrophota bacterium]